MEDSKIIELYWNRDEAALSEASQKYGKYCHSISFCILKNQEDSEECVNDTWLHSWNAMPPQRPASLKAFLGRITRNLSLNHYEKSHAKKRGSGEYPYVLDELSDCLPSPQNIEQEIEAAELTGLLNRFLAAQPYENRRIFVQRYWYLCSIRQIALDCELGRSAVKMRLMRMREELKKMLLSEGLL